MKNFENKNGFYGRFGGSFIPAELQKQMDLIEKTYKQLRQDSGFMQELRDIQKNYQGRPTPITYARNLSAKIGGADIYLKREDLNHTGAHKLNHCMGEALLAKYMGKKKLIAETGAGQHGVALATACAYFQLECEIHMGEIDIKKEKPNVNKMQILGAKIVPVSFGQKTLKDAVDSAFAAYMQDYENSMYAIGSVVGPHPFPQMVADFQSVVGYEAEKQFKELTGKQYPNHVIACVGGGSNAIGLFQGFLEDEKVKLYGVEPLGRGNTTGLHAATLTYGTEGVLHGFKSLLLQDENGAPAPVYSIASGLDYPGVGPAHAYLKEIGRVAYQTITDAEALDMFFELSKTEGIIPALESAHAVAYGKKLAQGKKGETILINLSGRGDKDLDFVLDNYKQN